MRKEKNIDLISLCGSALSHIEVAQSRAKLRIAKPLVRTLGLR